MHRIIFAIFVAAILLGCPLAGPGWAQDIPESLEGGPEASIKERKNSWTVGMVGGLLSGTPMRFADELAKALNEGDDLRVIPMVSYGMASNLDDLLYLRGVDVAITQSDVFEYFRTERKTPNLNRRVNYILRLPISEVHILAGPQYKTIKDLEGQKVNFGPAGAGSSLTGAIIFQRLGIKVEALHENSPDALQKVKSGEFAAMIRNVGKPIDFFTKIGADSGLHFLPVPFTEEFQDYYAIGVFTHDDYPNLVPEGGRVETIAVPTVLAVYNWNKGHDRYRKVERFVNRLFSEWDKFQKPPYHPKWRDVTLNATVPGWSRFSVAEEMLQKVGAQASAQDGDLKQDFNAFLQAGNGAPKNDAERDALFQEFLKWRQSQEARAR